LKDTVQATKALQQLSNLSLTKRTCWSGSSAYTCGNSIPTNKQRQKNLDKPITSIDKSSSKELSTYQKRKKDRVANSTHCPDSVVKDVCETNDWPEKSVVDFSFCNQDKLVTDEIKYSPHEEIMELKRQMASVRHDVQVSKVSSGIVTPTCFHFKNLIIYVIIDYATYFVILIYKELLSLLQ
jgi:hypothetical protein